MQRTKAFFIKLALTLGMLLLVLGLLYEASIIDIIIIGLVLTLVAFLGDMFILPKVGNIIAALTDTVLAFLVIWLLGSYLFESGSSISILSAAFLSSLFIGAGELYYHRYLRNHVFVNVDAPNNFTRVGGNLQTEFAEDFDKELQKKREENS